MVLRAVAAGELDLPVPGPGAGAVVPDELFADLFAERGRCSVPPSVVATVMVLQRLEWLSDRDAVDRYAFDVRWRYAAGVGRARRGGLGSGLTSPFAPDRRRGRVGQTVHVPARLQLLEDLDPFDLLDEECARVDRFFVRPRRERLLSGTPNAHGPVTQGADTHSSIQASSVVDEE